jgi:UDP-4-amino-4,6-dideoxy-N-acetyl-beta-L-altrosamine transaminase
MSLSGESDEFIPYGRQSIDEDDIAAVVDVLRSDWLTRGPAVEEFEAALSEVCGGVPCAAVSSGTAALHCAYAAAGVGSGNEVVTTPLTFAATATTAMHLGATVKFADIDDATLNIDPEAVREACTPRTKAITAVDFAGQPADLDALRQIADEVGAVLIEDAAHAIGSRYRGRPVGSIADLTTFSFHPVKTVTTAEGGAVATRNPAYLREVRRFRNHGLVRDPDDQREPNEGPWHQEIHGLGLNYRMPDVLASLGRSQLKKLQRFAARRAQLVARYRRALSDVDEVRLVDVRPDLEPVWHLFVVRILDGRRRETYEALRRARIGAQVHYLPVHRHPIFKELGYEQVLCPVAEAAYEEILSLPIYPNLSDKQQDRVIEVLLSAVAK